MNQKGFSNVILGVVILLAVLAGASGYFIFRKESAPRESEQDKKLVSQQTATLASFQSRKEDQKVVLYKISSDGSSTKTGLEVPIFCDGDVDFCKTYKGDGGIEIAVSPQKTTAVVRTWGPTPIWGDGSACDLLNIVNIDGSNRKEIARTCLEGSGGMTANSIRWSDDGKYIQYSEIQGNGFVEPPTRTTTTYRISVETGKKELISRKSEALK